MLWAVHSTGVMRKKKTHSQVCPLVFFSAATFLFLAPYFIICSLTFFSIEFIFFTVAFYNEVLISSLVQFLAVQSQS